MDIATHAMMGAVLAGPLLATRPLTGACFVLGSVLPDLDALSRCFGKQAFLRWHQSYTHGLPVILLAGLLAWLFIPEGLGEPWAPLALVAGLLLHVGLDVTNTYGTAVLSPLSSRRFCAEWVFFIDAFVVTASAAAILIQWLPLAKSSGGIWLVAAVYALLLASYWLAKTALHARARHLATPDTLSLIPSSLVPWLYYGCAELEGGIRVFRISALSGHIDQEQDCPVHDAAYADVLSHLPEFQIMRQLSPAYRITDATAVAEGTRLTCRDLRTRNFGGRFGQLVAVMSSEGQILTRRFYV